MRVFIGMECSGRVREAFRSRGHDAWSCDFEPPEDGSPYHIQGNVFDHLNESWDVGIFHPTCTYLTCSAEWAYGHGPYHQKVRSETLVGQARREARLEAIEDVKRLWAAPIPSKCIENLVGVLSRVWRKPSQIIQPYQFGDDASKATCLWLDGLPLLIPTHQIAPRIVSGRQRWGNQTDSGQNRLSPGPDRWKERSRTFPGIAAAMAEQWSAS